MNIKRDRDNDEKGTKCFLAEATVNGKTWYKRLYVPIEASDKWAREELQIRFNKELEGVR